MFLIKQITFHHHLANFRAEKLWTFGELLKAGKIFVINFSSEFMSLLGEPKFEVEIEFVSASLFFFVFGGDSINWGKLEKFSKCFCFVLFVFCGPGASSCRFYYGQQIDRLMNFRGKCFWFVKTKVFLLVDRKIHCVISKLCNSTLNTNLTNLIETAVSTSELNSLLQPFKRQSSVVDFTKIYQSICRYCFHPRFFSISHTNPSPAI